MGEENRFFRALNRINAILFLLTLSTVLLLALWGGYLLFASSARHHREYARDTPPDKQPLLFGGTLSSIDTPYTVLDGTGEAFLVLHRDVPYKPVALSSGGSGGDEIQVNLLIVDLASGRSRWMFRGTKRCIAASAMMHAKNPDAVPAGAPNPVTAVLLAVAEHDNNGNGVVDCGDGQSLYLYRPGAAEAVPLMPATFINSIHQTADGQMLVTYSKGDGDRVAIFETSGFHRISDESLPFPPPER
jgi:hypothetical protein